MGKQGAGMVVHADEHEPRCHTGGLPVLRQRRLHWERNIGFTSTSRSEYIWHSTVAASRREVLWMEGKIVGFYKGRYTRVDAAQKLP